VRQPFGDGWVRYGSNRLEVSADGGEWDDALAVQGGVSDRSLTPDLGPTADRVVRCDHPVDQHRHPSRLGRTSRGDRLRRW
jgi:hypothetical protein